MCPFHLKNQLKNPRYQGLFAVNVGCLEGTCANGDTCRFAHSLRELRPLPDLSKTKLCSSYSRQVKCNVANCPFAHSPQELRTSSSVFYKVSLCNFYKNNRCWNGANCRFAHGTEELRASDAPEPAKMAETAELKPRRRSKSKTRRQANPQETWNGDEPQSVVSLLSSFAITETTAATKGINQKPSIEGKNIDLFDEEMLKFVLDCGL